MVTYPHARKALVSLAVAAAGALPARAGAFSLSYAYRLSTMTGAVKTSWAGLSPDGEHRELFVVAGDLVHVFNDAGMEIHRFGDDEAVGRIVSVAALPDGDLVALSYAGTEWRLVRLDFRGDPAGALELKGVPARFLADFHPNAIAVARARIHLADPGTLKVLVLEADGGFAGAHDFSKYAVEEKPATKREGMEDDEEPASGTAVMTGFSVDQEGNILFTIAPIFKAFVSSPDGSTVRSFGKPGGTPGKFAIVAGIAADEQGRIYVVDTLKAAVMVYDREFSFLGEYGYSGRPSDALLGPRNVAVMSGKVYVAQNGKRGVSVFTVTN